MVEVMNMAIKMLHVHLAEEESLKTLCGRKREEIEPLNGNGVTWGEEVWSPRQRETSELNFDVCVTCQAMWDEICEVK